MVVGLDHPLVADYLRRLDEAAASLSAGRRGELVEEIRAHVGEALAAIGDDEPSVRGVLDRLGRPEDIVAAERDSLVSEPVLPQAPAGPQDHGQQPSYGQQPAWGPATAAPAPPYATRVSPWGPLELVAVLGLTVGSLVVPILGPIVGLACAWASQQWNRREKIVATLLTALTPLVIVLAGAGVFLTRNSVTSVEQGPVIVEEGPAVQAPPVPEVSP